MHTINIIATDTEINNPSLKRSLFSVLTAVALINTPSGTVYANSYSAELEKDFLQYFSIKDADQTNLDIAGDITLEAWVKLESVPPSDNLQVQVLSKDKGGVNRQYYLSFQKTGTTDQISTRFETANGQSTAIYPWTPILNNWFHIASTRAVATGEVRVYINGVQFGSTHMGPTGDIDINTGADFYVGARDSAAADIQHLDGLIDEVRVWSAVRTEAEIQANMFNSLSGTEAGLQGYWNFEETTVDATVNQNDLVAGNGPVFSTDVPFTAPPSDPLTAIEGVIQDVLTLNISNGISNSLDAKLDSALNALDDMNGNNDVAAINSLYAFISAVEAQRGKKISEDDACSLIQSVDAVIVQLGGATSGSSCLL